MWAGREQKGSPPACVLKPLFGRNGLCNAGITGATGLIPASGRSPGRRNGYPLQCSCLENTRDWGDWWAAVYWGRKRPLRLSRVWEGGRGGGTPAREPAKEKEHPGHHTPGWKQSHMPPGAIPVALHMLSVNGKQYQSMFIPHVLSLFTYQCPGQLYADRTPKTASEGGSPGRVRLGARSVSPSVESCGCGLGPSPVRLRDYDCCPSL